MDKQPKRSLLDVIQSDQGQLYITGITIIVVSLVDLLGIIDNVPWFGKRLPAITLLVLGTFVMCLTRFLRHIDIGVAATIQATKSRSVEIMHFKSIRDVYGVLSDKTYLRVNKIFN